jgi:molybdate transport system ATP-binding protein
VNLKGLESRRGGTLRGQQQRVAGSASRAIACCSERHFGGDRSTRRSCELATLRRDLAMPMVLITHDLDEAAMLADRMCILHRGRTLQSAPAHELMSGRPALVARLTTQGTSFAARARHGAAATRALQGLGSASRAPRRTSPSAPGALGDPGLAIILHRRDRPSPATQAVRGTIADFLPLGEREHRDPRRGEDEHLR